MTLPIHAFRSPIVDAVKDNKVVIITAETGAGKSTQVPQYLLEEGCQLVVTQPRRLAARTVAQRVAFERHEEVGQTIGVRTRDDKVDSAKTRCLFVTDGLALVRELMGVGKHNVLIIDEVHEWNMNIEVLVAWVRLQLERGADFKAVLMSATLEAEKLAAYFGGAPIISVPGRLFPVEDRRPSSSPVEDAARLLREGRNVLVFQPGKSEISKFIADLEAVPGLNAEIMALHGELTPEEQARCFRHYGRPKCVVATNVAQTSVTIDDIDAVIDSGMERRNELVSGVEGLYLKAISRADAEQRKGRAGRTKPGVYIDHCTAFDRLEFPKAEILRRRLDQTVLRLAEAGFDAEELQFFHDPGHQAIHDAKTALKALGCMDNHGKVTCKGKRVATMPISVESACMVIEAEKRGVVADILTAVAILEVGGITSNKDEQGFPSRAWGAHCPNELDSDIFAHLAVYRAAQKIPKQDLRKKGVMAKAYFQAIDVRRHLEEALRGKVQNPDQSSGKRDDIMKAICAGMVDHLYRNDFGYFVNGDGVSRQLNRDSVVAMPQWLVAQPWDLEIKGRFGNKILRLIRMATRVEPDWLVEVAPQLAERRIVGLPYFDPEKDSVVVKAEVYFRGQRVKEEAMLQPNHAEAAKIFAAWLASQMV